MLMKLPAVNDCPPGVTTEGLKLAWFASIPHGSQHIGFEPS